MKTPDTIRLTNLGAMDDERLIDAFRAVQTVEDTARLLKDLLTAQELESCVRRLQVAYLLEIGTPYSQISETTGMSSRTISKISKKLTDKRGGYYTALKNAYPLGINRTLVE